MVTAVVALVNSVNAPLLGEDTDADAAEVVAEFTTVL
jgi:hypothetical protein